MFCAVFFKIFDHKPQQEICFTLSKITKLHKTVCILPISDATSYLLLNIPFSYVLFNFLNAS